MKKHILLGILLPVLLAVSCGENSPFVSREELVQSQEKNHQLTASLDSLQRSFNKQAGELSSIISDIAELSSRTARIRVDGTEKPLSQYETAKGDIQAIRERLDNLEKEVEAGKKKSKSDLAVSAKTIQQLRATLDLKEKEIINLQKQIQEKDQTIQKQDETISVQKDTISRQMQQLQAQKKELQRQVQAQIDLLYKAGNRFSEIADEGDFKVTGRKNKMNVKQYRKAIYEEALDLYEAAAAQGHKAALDSVVSTKFKIRELVASKN